MPSENAKSAGAFRTISEVSDRLNVPQHVLRFWETKFSQVKPLKRAGGRRYYRPEDIELLERLRDLLYGEGYTIRGVQKLLREKGVKALVSAPKPASLDTPPSPVEAPVPQAEPDGQTLLFPTPKKPAAMSDPVRGMLAEVLEDLRQLRAAI